MTHTYGPKWQAEIKKYSDPVGMAATLLRYQSEKLERMTQAHKRLLEVAQMYRTCYGITESKAIKEDLDAHLDLAIEEAEKIHRPASKPLEKV